MISVNWPNGVNTTAPAVYSIPEQGETNWYSLTNFLVALGRSAQGTTSQRCSLSTYTSSPITVQTTDCVVVSSVSGGASTVNLPAGTRGAIYYIIDGLKAANTHHITIHPNSGDTINGGSSTVLTDNGAKIGLCYDFSNTNWVIISFSVYV